MTVLQSLMALPAGAEFTRADLHIHSFGASHDVRDTTMTPAAIVATAIQERLGMISITDHNDITNVQIAIDAANGSALTIIPGIELSTPQGHLLCYLPTVQALGSFVSKLTIVDKGTPNSRCQTSMLDCLNALEATDGFAVLAHVDADTGYEKMVPGNSPHKLDVIGHARLLAIELKAASSDIRYADGDPDAGRAQMGVERIKRLGLGSKQYLARVLNSDAHSLAKLGKNAQGDRKVTRIKCASPSFEAVRIALQDADARVRIEQEIPDSVPQILGIHLSGGFLDQQAIHFSRNLNCIIGGRGAGKSTTFEALRFLSEKPSESPVVDSEVWPNELQLFWKDKTGQVHSLSRNTGCDLVNLDDDLNGPVYFQMDCFGQGEAAKISQQAQANPLALLDYLDKFVDLTDVLAEEQQARDELLRLQSDIEKATGYIDQIPSLERALHTTRQQLEALTKANAKEVIELQRHIASEREIRLKIVAKVDEVKAAIAAGSGRSGIKELKGLATPAALKVGASEFQAIAASADDFDSAVGAAETSIQAKFKEFSKAVEAQLGTWKQKDSDASARIEAKRKELEAKGVRLDMKYIQKLATDEASQAQNLKNLRSWVPHLADLKKERAEALRKRWSSRSRIAALRSAYGRQASTTLQESLTDLQVSLKYDESAYSADGAQLIIQTMGWRTVQQQRADALVSTLTIPKLLDAIERKQTAPLVALKTQEGVGIFDKAAASEILERLGQPAIRFALERCEIHELPKLQVTRAIQQPAGATRYVRRDFSRLSLGQQQSVLLALMLSANSIHPLIIDQPEDNLDSEFIYQTLVPVLRRAKERRQVIVVTHNANIAVLGDAEQIIVLKSTSEQARIVARGSIDDQATRGFACEILEGAQEAFQRRSIIYGL